MKCFINRNCTEIYKIKTDFDYKQEQEQLVAKRLNALSTEIAQKFTK